VSANKTDISQIRKYLNGELDAKAMHRLEREAQDDPFLMDALEGYEVSGKDQQANLSELQQRLADRIAPKKERSIILWRILPIAASLLVAISIGYLLLKPNPASQKAMNLTLAEHRSAQADKLLAKKDTVKSLISGRPLIAQYAVPQSRLSPRRKLNEEIRIDEPTGAADIKVVKDDTATYLAKNYSFNTKANTVEDLLKKLPGVDVDASGYVTLQGKQITKARINGKDFFGNEVNQAVKNLPANAIQKIQIIEDYGDQANMLARTNESKKILDIKTDTANMQQSGLNNALAGRIAGVDTHSLREVTITGYGTQAKKAVTSASVTTIKADTAMFKSAEGKAKKLEADSVSNLAEVVVVGYADKSDSPVQPVNGWKSYLAYIKEQSVMPDNSIGKVRLAFKVGKDGIIYGIRILKGSTMMINQKAIEILKSGPAWIGSNSNKEIKVKIKFHKKT
jgi:hypothetical protein